MQTKPLYRLIFTAAAALAAAFVILTTPTVRAGLFNVPSEPANWNGPFVSFDSGGVWSSFDWSFDGTTIDLTRQYNLVTATPNPNGGAAIPNNADTPNLLTYTMPNHSSDDSAYIAEIDLGYNKQFGHFVIGGLFGFSGTHVNDTSSFFGTSTGNTITVNPAPPGGTPSPTDVYYDNAFRSERRIEQEWAGYVGGQLGFAWNRFFIYGTGGVSFAQIDVNSYDGTTTIFSGTPTPTPTIIPVPNIVGVSPSGSPVIGSNTARKILHNNSIQSGWYAGVGFLYAFTDSVSAGLEYRHNDFGDTEYHLNVSDKGTTAGTGARVLFPSATTVSNENNEVLFKVSIALGNLGTKHSPTAISTTTTTTTQ